MAGLVLSCNNNLLHTHTHTHPFNGPLSGTTRVGQYQKGKTIWILLKQETVSGYISSRSYASLPAIELFLPLHWHTLYNVAFKTILTKEVWNVQWELRCFYIPVIWLVLDNMSASIIWAIKWGKGCFTLYAGFLKPVSTIKGKGSPYSTTERRVPELIRVLGSQPAGEVSHKPGSRLPGLQLPPQPLRGLLPISLLGKHWKEARSVWTVCLRPLPDSVVGAIWTRAILRVSPAR